MSKNIYVGNLPLSYTEGDVRSLLAPHGDVTSISMITDRATGRARGFAFVEMEMEDAATAAIRSLNRSVLDGRSLRVNEARGKGDGHRH